MQLAKRFAATILGGALLLLGLAMMVLPGPGILVIVAVSIYQWIRKPA